MGGGGGAAECTQVFFNHHLLFLFFNINDKKKSRLSHRLPSHLGVHPPTRQKRLTSLWSRTISHICTSYLFYLLQSNTTGRDVKNLLLLSLRNYQHTEEPLHPSSDSSAAKGL